MSMKSPPRIFAPPPNPSFLPNPISVTSRREMTGKWMSPPWPPNTEDHTHPPITLVNFRGGMEMVIALLGYRYQSHHPSKSHEGRGHSNSTDGKWVKGTVEKGS